jgi:hypothetical protein
MLYPSTLSCCTRCENGVNYKNQQFMIKQDVITPCELNHIYVE